VTEELFYLSGPEAVSLQGALIVVETAKNAMVSKGRFALAVSGGATPTGLFKLLGTTFRKDVYWDRTDFFWVDERCVPPDHEDSNYRGAYENFLSKTDIPPANIHRIRGESDPEEEAVAYDDELRRYFGRPGLPVFDLIILGVGEDGHTASLFPGSTALSEKKRFVVPVYTENLKSWRITLTLPVLNNASNILFLVSGKSKSSILKEILGGENRKKYPAGLIQPVQGSMTWLIDKEASALLQRSDQTECYR
jgi:6-phosphogluconolactonase